MQIKLLVVSLILPLFKCDLVSVELTNPSKFIARPTYSLDVTVVDLTVHNFIFLNLDQTNLLLDINITLRWADWRFITPTNLTYGCYTYSRAQIDHNQLDSVWKPRLNFHGNQHAVVNDLPFRNEFLWYDSDGMMLHQQHYKLKIPCRVTLDRFPMDEAKCFVNFADMAYDDSKVKLHWNTQIDPITVLAQRHIQEHELAAHYVDTFKSRSKSENYTELLTVLVFKRHYSWYLLQAYVPSGLIIFVNWLHCTLRPQNAVPRLQIGSAMLLAVIVLFFNVLRNVPRFGRVKAMDVWLIGCISALMITAAETAIVALLMHFSQKALEMRRGTMTGRMIVSRQHMSTGSVETSQKWAKTAKIIDNLFVLIFPFGFISFVLVYWIYYLLIYSDN